VDGSRVSLSVHEEAILASKGVCFGSPKARLHFSCLEAEMLFWFPYYMIEIPREERHMEDLAHTRYLINQSFV
jgi:hypothetical protein